MLAFGTSAKVLPIDIQSIPGNSLQGTFGSLKLRVLMCSLEAFFGVETDVLIFWLYANGTKSLLGGFVL